MLFYLRNRNKTIKELRKNVSLTVKELSLIAKLETTDIMKIDTLKLKDTPKNLQNQLIPIFRGDAYDNIPW